MNKMSFEELVDKLASFKWDGSLDQADQFSKLITEILTHYAELQAYKADIENAIKGAMDDNPNEKHCSCVPLLKVKIKQLEEKVKQLEAENKEWAELLLDAAKKITGLQEKVKTLAEENKELKEMLGWLESMMLPDDNYCEIYLGGLRNFMEGHATAFQIESQPEKFKTTHGKTLLEAINNAKNNR
jgi:DNA repair exonuclease SbcCD ATPase subunit